MLSGSPGLVKSWVPVSIAFAKITCNMKRYRKGMLTSMNAVLWLLNFSNSLPKGAVTLSNSKGGFRGGPKGAFFPQNYFVFFLEFSGQ